MINNSEDMNNNVITNCATNVENEEKKELINEDSASVYGITIEEQSLNFEITVRNYDEDKAIGKEVPFIPEEALEYMKKGQELRARTNSNSQAAIAIRNARKQREENVQE